MPTSGGLPIIMWISLFSWMNLGSTQIWESVDMVEAQKEENCQQSHSRKVSQYQFIASNDSKWISGLYNLSRLSRKNSILGFFEDRLIPSMWSISWAKICSNS